MYVYILSLLFKIKFKDMRYVYCHRLPASVSCEGHKASNI